MSAGLLLTVGLASPALADRPAGTLSSTLPAGLAEQFPDLATIGDRLSAEQQQSIAALWALTANDTNRRAQLITALREFKDPPVTWGGVGITTGLGALLGGVIANTVRGGMSSVPMALFLVGGTAAIVGALGYSADKTGKGWRAGGKLTSRLAELTAEAQTVAQAPAAQPSPSASPVSRPGPPASSDEPWEGLTATNP